MLKHLGFYGRLFAAVFAVFCMISGAMIGPNELGVCIGCSGALMLVGLFMFALGTPRE